MAHEITSRAGITEMAYVGALPWHGLGQKLAPGASIDEWTEAAGMAWAIRRSKVRFATSADESVPLELWPDKQVLFRADTNAPLGVVSPDYHIVQPKAVLEFFRDLTAEAGFTLETAGTLFGGRKYWALAKIAPSAEVRLGDHVGGYCLLSTSADGTQATEARYTTVRVVCNNTLSMALRGRAAVRQSHAKRFDQHEVKAKMDLAPQAARETFDSTMEIFRALADKPLSDAAQGKLIMDSLIPGWSDLDAEGQTRLQGRKDIREVSALAAGKGLLGPGQGTAWGTLNAITQWIDHTGKARSADAKLDSMLWGAGAAIKSRALDLAMRETLGETLSGLAERGIGGSRYAPAEPAPSGQDLSLESLGLA